MSTENHHFNAEIFHAAANTGQKDSENDVVAEHLDNVPAKDEYCGADHGADSQLHRTLSTRHVTMVALGSAIGMGMWLGSGTSLQNGGPVSLVLAFVVASTVLWGMTQSLGEMAVMYPLPSAYVRWVTMFVSPAAGFAVGWGYWCSDWITVANELQGVVTVMRYWNDTFPTAGFISIFWAVMTLINICAVKLFGEFEVIASTIKFSWMIIIIISFIVITAGGAPQGSAIGFRYWNSVPFLNGLKGFLNVLPTCFFSMAGSENAAQVAAETVNPRKSVPTAVRSVWMRLALFYVLGSFTLTLTVSPKDPSLFGSSGNTASPFVIAFQNANIPAMAHITNAVIFISVVSTGTFAAYGGSRILVGLAHIQMAPKVCGNADKVGRPWAALAPALIIGGGISYINVSNTGEEVFGWLSSLVSLLTIFGWGLICIANLRFRYAWKIQGRPKELLPWRSWAVPWSAWWTLSWCILILVVQFYLSVWPLGKEPSAKNFFANFISAIAFVALWIGAHIWYRCPLWVDASKVNLDEHRRFYSDYIDEEEGKGGMKVLKQKLGFILK